jgi:rSAM/selenodomain-associated transferase 1
MASAPRRVAFAPRLVIMAKSPVAGRVKRRLARGIGDVAAIRFYRNALNHTLARLGADPRWRAYLAVAPDHAVAAPYWPSAAKIPRIPQGAGDLGARMQTLFDRLPPGPVIIVGSDIPRIGPAQIAHAFKLLGRADAVFGPAPDGGYWLIGFKRSPRCPRPFRGVPWSTGEALAATRANLRGSTVALTSLLSDVDTAEDYRSERNAASRRILRRA